jgi:hypothetical protein
MAGSRPKATRARCDLAMTRASASVPAGRLRTAFLLVTGDRYSNRQDLVPVDQILTSSSRCS